MTQRRAARPDPSKRRLSSSSETTLPALARPSASDGLGPQAPDEEVAGSGAARPTTIVCVVDLDGTILYVDRTVPGITREEVIGSAIFEYVTADNHEPLRSYLAQVVETKSSVSYEIPGIGPYGAVIQYRTHLGPIERDGEVVALAFVSTELGEQPPEIEDRYRVLADAGMEGLIIHDRNTIVDVNAAVCEMFGYDCADLVGHQIKELFAAASWSLLQRASFYQSGALREATALRRDGSPFRVEVCGKTLPHPSGLAAVIAIRDISKRRSPGRSRQAPSSSQRARARRRAVRKAPRVSIDLSSRELDVLELLAQGMTNRAASERLGVSPRTVDHHVSHILGKLAAPNRTAAAMTARRKGLLRQDK